MERAGRLLGQLNRNSQLMTNEELARAAWPVAVGKKIASYTVAVSLVRTSLVVEVQDITWQRQLNTLTQQIVKNLTDVLGPGVVTDLALRPMTPKRSAQRAETPRADRPAQAGDEADAIADPLLRRVYRISRNRASA